MNLAARGLRAHLSLPKPSSNTLSRPMPVLRSPGYRYVRTKLNSLRLKTSANPKNGYSSHPSVVKPPPIQNSFFDMETMYLAIVWGVPVTMLLLGIKELWDEPKRKKQIEEAKRDARENWRSYIDPKGGE